MADFFCSFLDSRSFTTNFQIFFPSKPFCAAFVPTIPHSHNPRTRRSKRKPLHLTLLSEPKFPTPSSGHSDLISIHEHSDGSLLFRFGDPSESAENVKPVEPKILKDIKKETQEGLTTVNVLDGDIERKVIVKKQDKEVRSAGSTEVADKGYSIGIGNESISAVETESKSSQKLSEDSKKLELETNKGNSIGISNESINVVERENESSEKLSEDSKKVELPVSISRADRKDSSAPSEDTKESSGSSADLESVGYVEEGSSEKHDDISPLVSVTVLDESSKVDNSSAATESAEEKIGGEMMLQSIHLKPDHVIDITDDIITKESTGETIAATNVSANNQSTKAGTRIEIVENVKGNDRSEVSPVSPDSPQLEPSMSLSPDTEDQNSEIVMPTEIVEDGNTSDTNVVATFPLPEAVINFSADSKNRNSEAAADFSEYSKDQNLEAGNGMPSKTVEDGSQSDMIEVIPMSHQLEAEPILDEEADNDSMEESAVADRNESAVMLNNSQKSLLEPRTDDDHSMRNRDFVEASDCEVTELKSIESVVSRIKADFVLSSSAVLLPHPSKVLTGGEDAYFISGHSWLGVADGVSQWSLEGVNPGIFAQELIKNCEIIVSDCTGDSVNNPVEILKHSVDRTQSPGSSTVLIAYFDGQALQVANIGDSGFIILRHGTVYEKSSPMLHEFHFPVQIERGDDPSYLTEEYRVDLEEGDVIITATDGLFDNLYEQEISSIVLALLDSDKRLEEIAELLATQAQEVGRSASSRSPFADAAQAAGYVGYSGGKLDDVAVIVSVVGRQ
ncbi:putative protein phosphatase 2C 62 [Abeliophyllum distichum]|uniref:PPM-type phosphatase domain-containing protein n=1 Tax=Abeliophyllum distichum TaxID=126358 RepID=A0ABD1PCU2_9LAMI